MLMKFKKSTFLFLMLLITSSISFAESNYINDVREIENEYQMLLQKEAEKLEEFKQERSILANHLENLKNQRENKENLQAKLEKDSHIRWHRDKYKELLGKYKDFSKKLDKAIEDTETKISELDKLIDIMGN